MHAVVNHLPIKAEADWTDIAAKFEAFARKTRAAYPKLKVALLLKAGDGEAIFVGVYQDRESAEHVSKEVAAPWFAENIRQYLAGPVARSTGEVIAGVA